MLGKILVVVVVVVAMLAIASEERVFHKWGVVGSCEVVRSPSGDTSQWRACTEGLLTGYPSLIDNCTYQTTARGYQYWRCSGGS
jgi:hypothetical protein